MLHFLTNVYKNLFDQVVTPVIQPLAVIHLKRPVVRKRASAFVKGENSVNP
jgi:hypothetical protein